VRKMLEACPSCGGSLVVSGVACNACGIEIKGRFRTCAFCRLTEEQSTFLLMFVERRGNLSEMEKALGISYPTVRSKLEEIIRALESQANVEAPSATGIRDAILEQVARGDLTPEQALGRLSTLDVGGA
jgi:hypothetical protein